MTNEDLKDVFETCYDSHSQRHLSVEECEAFREFYIKAEPTLPRGDRPKKIATKRNYKSSNRETTRIRTPLNMGLGDVVESALKTVGITEERVSKWLGAPCGCSARKEKLNRLSQWAGDVLRGVKADIESVLK